MKKIIILISIVILLSACTKRAESQDSFVFTDDLSREVRVTSHNRTASLIGSLAQIWMLSGGEVVACPDDGWNDLNLNLAEDVVNLGKISKLSLEGLISSNPDFILASPNNNQQLSWKENFEGMNIPTAYLEVYDFDDYLHVLDIFTTINNSRDLYQKYGLDVDKEIKQILHNKRTDSPKVLCMLASTQYFKAKNSQSSIMGAMLNDLGCINLADSEESLLENLSIEYILKEDPEYIFITQRGDDEEGMKKYVQSYFEDHPLWKELSAVKNNNVYFMDKNLYNLKPNHRWAEAYRGLAEVLNK